jgi:hypothetical protein
MRGANQLFYTQIDHSLPQMNPANVRVTSNAITTLLIDTRGQKDVDDFKKSLVKTKKAAVHAWNAPYHSVRSRIVGAQPKSVNGGHHTLLDPIKDLALLVWINLHMTTGMKHPGYSYVLVN